jgi:hypothetical protein
MWGDLIDIVNCVLTGVFVVLLVIFIGTLIQGGR